MNPSNLVLTLRRNFDQKIDRWPKDAADILDRLRDEDPFSLETRGRELDLLLRTKRLREARSMAVALLSEAPGSARVQLLAGRAAYGAHDYVAALEHFRESRRIARRWRIELWIGKTQSQLGKLDEAEATLLPIAGDHAEAHHALAWVYERKGDWERALRSIDSYLAARPSDRGADAQRRRLRTRALAASDILEDVAALSALGEEVADDALEPYVDALLRSGESVKAREVVRARLASMSERTAASLAWACRRHQAYDLTIDLFVRSLPSQLHYVKHLNALEADAARCLRVAEVIAAYEKHATREPALHGRIKKLRQEQRVGGAGHP